MDFSKLTEKAKHLIDRRGGMASVKEDAMEVKDIAGKDESLTQKAEDATAAIKDPGAPGPSA
jgi:hypothetical protein